MYHCFSPQIPDNVRNQTVLSEIKKAAVKYQNMEIKELPYSKYKIYFETGSRGEYEADYIEHRRRLNVYTAMALSSEENIWSSGLEDIIWAICNEFTWAFPAHIKDENDIIESSITVDLFAAETGLALSEICYLLSNRLSPLVIGRVQQEVRKRLIKPYTERNLTFHKDNWSAVCAGCIGMMVMYWGSREEYDLIEEKVMRSMEDFIGSYQDDGCCLEGALYWGYGFGYFCYFAQMLREYSDGKKDLFALEKVKQIAMFRQKIYLEKNIVVPFADAPHNYNYHIGLLHFLAAEYDEVEVPDESYAACFDDDIRHRFADFIRDFYWYHPGLKGEKKQENSIIFSQSQWYIKKLEHYSFAAKGGRNNEPHNHNDIGNFIIFSDGKFIIDDLGWPEYDRDYFGEKRYENICASSAGHSVPVLNGIYQERGKNHYSTLLEAGEKTVSFDLTKAYPAGSCETLIRTFSIREKEICLEDRISGIHGTIKERFVTRIPPVIKEQTVIIDEWRIECSDSVASIELEEKEFRPRLSVCKMDMQEVEKAYFVDFVFSPVENEKRVRFIIKKAYPEP